MVFQFLLMNNRLYYILYKAQTSSFKKNMGHVPFKHTEKTYRDAELKNYGRYSTGLKPLVGYSHIYEFDTLPNTLG